MNPIDPLLLDHWLYEVLSGIQEREQDLAANLGKRIGGLPQPFIPGPEFASLHMADLARVLEHLHHGIPDEGISIVNERRLLNLMDTLLNRQGLKHPHYRPCYWTCAAPESLDGDAYIQCVVQYSAMVVSLIHAVLLRGGVHPKTQSRAESAILSYFLGFSRDGFPAHGHDIDLDYEAYTRVFTLGNLRPFLVAHASDLPSFFDRAEQLVTWETQHGPSRSPFAWTDPDQRFSALGSFCLDVLAEAQRQGRSKRSEPRASKRNLPRTKND